MKLDAKHKEILAVCAYDDMGLWRVIAKVDPEKRREFPLARDVRTTAVAAVRVLLEEGLIEAGNPNGPTFKAMSGTPGDVIAAIEKALDELRRPIGPGDVCWLRATAAGEKRAKELGLKGY